MKLTEQENENVKREIITSDSVPVDLALAVLGRMDEKTIDELSDCIDCELIYYDDQWELLKFYFIPADEISLNRAIEAFEIGLIDIFSRAGVELE